MTTFLGVPILLRGVAYGNLYLTEKAGGEDFTEDDKELVELLASQAAVAIENARLYEAATRWSRQLESLNEVGNALATETDLDVAARARRAAAAGVARRRGWCVVAAARTAADDLRIVTAAAGDGARPARGSNDVARSTRRPVGCSSGARASGSTRCSTIREVEHRGSRAASARAPASGCRCSCTAGRSASSPRTTSSMHRRALHRRRRPACRDVRVARGGRRRAVRARRSATPCGGSSPRRSSSGGGSRASCTTRRARR